MPNITGLPDAFLASALPSLALSVAGRALVTRVRAWWERRGKS